MENSFELLCKEILAIKGIKSFEGIIDTDEYLIDIKVHFEQKRDERQEEWAFDNSRYIAFLSDDWKDAEKQEPGCFWRTYKVFREKGRTPIRTLILMRATEREKIGVGMLARKLEESLSFFAPFPV